jgi:hypothetical protein
MIRQIATRIAFIAAGYVVAMAVIGILVLANDMLMESGEATSFFVPQGPSILPPDYAKLVFTLAFVLIWPLLPALILILPTEVFRWRSLWVYLIGWTLAFAAIALLLSFSFSTIAATVATFSAPLGGILYWAIAGRHAGDFTEEAAS